MAETNTVETEAAVESDPIRIPHLLRALDKYLMQNPEETLGKVLDEILALKGTELKDLADEEITAFLTARATKWD